MVADHEKPPPPLCVWCNAPWTDDMLNVYSECDISFGDYGTLEGIETTIDVTCSSCNRLVYRKHVTHDGWQNPGSVKRS